MPRSKHRRKKDRKVPHRGRSHGARVRRERAEQEAEREAARQQSEEQAQAPIDPDAPAPEDFEVDEAEVAETAEKAAAKERNAQVFLALTGGILFLAILLALLRLFRVF